MASHEPGGFRLNVLNPGGRDPEQSFDSRSTTEAGHAPVNFHAYAACTGGSFFKETARAIAAKSPVLLLLRGDFRETERSLDRLQKSGLRVAVSLKETGLHQIADQLRDPARLRRFLRIVNAADACLASTPEAAEIYAGVRGYRSVAFIPTPYPLHDRRWDLSRPMEERRGIFVGTREWDVPSRNHFAALLAARKLNEHTGESVTVYNYDGRRGQRLLAEMGFGRDKLRILERGHSDYRGYLAVLAQHKIVLQFDASSVPGQVAGDALLCRVPCVGGNGAIDRLGHSMTCGAGRSTPELLQIATELLAHREAYAKAIAVSQREAEARLSFASVAAALEKFFA